MIVVAGAPVGPDGRAGPALERRVRHAVALFHAGHAPKLLISGGGEPAEADVGGALASSLGVPAHALMLERHARSTRENAVFSRALVGGRWLVVTCDFHAFRCRRVFAKVNPGAAVSAARTASAVTRLRMGVRELVVVLIYAMRGWL